MGERRVPYGKPTPVERERRPNKHMERKRAAALVVGMCLLGGGAVGTYRLVLHASTARPTAIFTASGQRIESLFSGLQPHPDRFAFVRIRKTTGGPVGSAGCLPGKPSLLSPVSSLFNPVSVHAQGNCIRTSCTGSHWTDGTLLCSGTGCEAQNWNSTVFDVSQPPEQGFMQTGIGGCSLCVNMRQPSLRNHDVHYHPAMLALHL